MSKPRQRREPDPPGFMESMKDLRRQVRRARATVRTMSRTWRALWPKRGKEKGS